MRIEISILPITLLLVISACQFGNDYGQKGNKSGMAVSGDSAKEQQPGDDAAKIHGMISGIFDAYNEGDQDTIKSTLAKYFDKEKIEHVYGSTGPVLNKLTVNDTVIYGESDDLRENKFYLCDYNIKINSEKAVVTGYVDGSAGIPGKGTLSGPWRMTAGVFKYSGEWYIAYFRLVNFQVIDLEYNLQLPDRFDIQKNKKWPLIVFLHGSGERGGSLDQLKQMNHSIPKIAASRHNFPFVVVSPLCPAAFSWYDLSFSVDRIIDEVVAKYNIDTDRIYLTGISLGGIGTWSIAAQFPDKFAAIAPVCGSVDPDKVERLKNLPVWAFHGADDTIVPMDTELTAVNRLKALGGYVKYTVYPNVGHAAWERAYPGSKLYTWFLRQSLADRRPEVRQAH